MTFHVYSHEVYGANVSVKKNRMKNACEFFQNSEVEPNSCKCSYEAHLFHLMHQLSTKITVDLNTSLVETDSVMTFSQITAVRARSPRLQRHVDNWLRSARVVVTRRQLLEQRSHHRVQWRHSRSRGSTHGTGNIRRVSTRIRVRRRSVALRNAL